MLKNKKAVIFDLDGTLVDSMWMWEKIDIEYLGRYGISLPEDLQREIEGMSFSETAVYFKERFQLQESLEEIKDTWNEMAYEKYTKEVRLKQGVKELLSYCKAQGIFMAIATSNSRHLVESTVSALEIEDYFNYIVTACEVKKGKPAPDVYLMAASKLGVDPKDCLVFEDIVMGIQAGKGAGMEVCAVEDDYSLYQKEEKMAMADYYIKDFSEMIYGNND